jgi:hypothetical protein
MLIYNRDSCPIWTLVGIISLYMIKRLHNRKNIFLSNAFNVDRGKIANLNHVKKDYTGYFLQVEYSYFDNTITKLQMLSVLRVQKSRKSYRFTR